MNWQLPVFTSLHNIIFVLMTVVVSSSFNACHGYLSSNNYYHYNNPSFLGTINTFNNNYYYNNNKRLRRRPSWLFSSNENSSSSSRSNSGSNTNIITDWVKENLESNNNTVTKTSTIKVSENDTLPINGLCIGPFRILASKSTYNDNDNNDNLIPIKLLVGRNGWGSGVHPTTRLCIEWLSENNVINGGEIILDYGCGSGILSIVALQLGASKIIGIDIEAEALITTERNILLNDLPIEKIELLHTRQVLPYDINNNQGGVDICIANILIGQLVRPSMIAAIVTNIKPDGLLCLSGIRPNEVNSLKDAYNEYIDWIDEQYDELAAIDTEGSISSYGFDCGIWCRVVGRKKQSSRNDDIIAMSELAVS